MRVSVIPNSWATPMGDCVTCHQNPNGTGNDGARHTKHMGNSYISGCDECHGTTPEQVGTQTLSNFAYHAPAVTPSISVSLSTIGALAAAGSFGWLLAGSSAQAEVASVRNTAVVMMVFICLPQDEGEN